MKYKLLFLFAFISTGLMAQVEFVSTGVGTAYNVNVPAIFPLRNGVQITFKAHVVCGPSPTINVTGTGPVLMKKEGGSTNLSSGDIKAGQIVTLAYDGTFWQMLSSSGNSPIAGAVTGTGTMNYVTKWNNPPGTVIGNSQIFDDGNNVGIGTAAPFFKLDVADDFSNAIGLRIASMTDHGDVAILRSRGNTVAPTQTIASDMLGSVTFGGHNGTNYVAGSNITSTATENFTLAGNGSDLAFRTTPVGSATAIQRMVIRDNGNVGIGIVGASAKLHVAGNNPNSIVNQVAEDTSPNIQSGIVMARSRGTIAAPTSVLNGDVIGGFFMVGYDGAGFGTNGPSAGIMAIAAEDFNPFSAGTDLFFENTPIGSNSSSVRMVIKQSGNIGIGNIFPSEVLDITGNLKFSGALMPNNFPGNFGEVLTSNGPGLPPTWEASGAGITGSGTTNYLARWTPSGTQLGIGATFDDGTNVGIGTTSPSSQLHVAGTIDPLQITVENGGNNFKTGYKIKTSLNEWFIGQEGDSNTGFRITDIDAGSPRFQIDQTGNVGIGTTSPLTKLHVAGNNPSSIANQIAEDTSPNIQGGIANLRSRGTISAPTAVLSGDFLGGFEMIGFDGAAFGSNGPNAGIGAVAAENFTPASTGTDLYFVTTSIGSNMATDKMVIKENGNVGIGTVNPSTNLEINGQIKITGGGPANGAVLTSDGAGLATWQMPGAASGPWTRNVPFIYPTTLTDFVGIGTSNPTSPLHVSGTSDPLLIQLENGGNAFRTGYTIKTPSQEWLIGKENPADFRIKDVTNNEVRLNITTSGNIGMGTTTPIVPLHVANNSFAGIGAQTSTDMATASSIAVVRSKGTVTAPMSILFGDDMGSFEFVGYNGASFNSGASIKAFAAENFGASNGSDLALNTTPIGLSSPVERMRIAADGNVGIGTTSPSTTFHVQGNARITGLAGPGTVVADAMGNLSIDASPSITGSGTPNYVARWTPSGTQLGTGALYDDGTRVGIGTSSPGDLLHIDGSVFGQYVRNQNNTSGNPTGFRISTPDRDWLLLQSLGGTSNGSLTMYDGSAGASRLHITTTGNVGIGTTTPSSLFSVGSGATSPFQVNSSGNITRINNITTSFPVAQGAFNTVLSNNGTGTLSWSSISSLGGVTSVTAAGPLSSSGGTSPVISLTGIVPIANGGTNNSTAYTTGSVIFSNGTSLTQNNGNFFWDNTNFRLGIGTNTPSSKLHVQGTTALTSSNNVINSVSEIFGSGGARVVGSYNWARGSGASGKSIGVVGYADYVNTPTDAIGVLAGFNSSMGTLPATPYGFSSALVADGNNSSFSGVFLNGAVAIGEGFTSSNVKLNIRDGHLQSRQTTLPTIGTTGTIVTATITAGGTDTKGNITTTGSLATGTTASITVTFNMSYSGVNPVVVVCPANLAARDLGLYVTTTTTAFTINFINNTGSSISAPSFNYMVIQ